MIRLIFEIDDGLVIPWCDREMKGESSTTILKSGGKVINEKITGEDFL
jgi:hypothetical protein